VGSERYTSFCLIQKFADLQSIGTTLQIISVFSLERTKGYIYIEAYKECDVTEACKGLCTVFASQMRPVQQNEVSPLFFIRNKLREVSMGMWGRVKCGKYKGDLAKVVEVDNLRGKAMIKLVPRIDLLALAKKMDGKMTLKQNYVPAPRLIFPRDLK
ncbi:hypothetical protein GIB67_000313, partial [Kingdonia uniflora]